MSNIFKSKEVYKKIKKDAQEDPSTMVPVYGMYVTGEYRPPTYFTTTLNVTDIIPRKADVANYTQKYVTQNIGFCTGIVSIDISKDIKVERYTQKSSTADTGFCAGVVSVDINNDIVIEKYTRNYVTSDTGFCAGLVMLDINSDINITKHPSNVYNMSPEPCIRITNLNTTRASITEYGG